jgi:hypothetical protein
VKPASVSYAMAPAQYSTVRDTVVVQPASFRWERQVDRHGRETMCKVEVPAVTRLVERTVQVAPATRVAHTTPAIYHTVRQTVQIAPAMVRKSFVAPTYSEVDRAVLVKPASERVITHPPVMGVAAENVLVHKGTTGWQRASRGWFH